MRYPEGHKEAVRARIVQGASRALRRQGLAGVSIPGLMKKAGLTHGGFYAHFKSRDALVAAAVRFAGEETAAGVFGPGNTLEEALARYLSRTHLEQPAQGCVVAALGSDGSRQRAPVRRAFAEMARGLVDLVEQKVHPGTPSAHPSDEALTRAALMVGAVVLGRLVDDEALADRILAAARKPLPS